MKRLYNLCGDLCNKVVEKAWPQGCAFFMYMICNYSEDVKTKSIAFLQTKFPFFEKGCPEGGVVT